MRLVVDLGLSGNRQGAPVDHSAIMSLWSHPNITETPVGANQ
jgi:hypothetical protein